MQAAILNVKFKKFEEEVRLVNKWAYLYTELLKDCVKCPMIMSGFYSSWAQYTILLESSQQREYVQCELKKWEIPTMVYYAKGMHQQKALFRYLSSSEAYPVTEAVCSRCLSLPMHPYLTEEDVTFVAGKLRGLLE